MALLKAVMSGDVQLAAALLATNPGAVDTVYKGRWTALHFAVDIFSIGLAKLLLNSGANVNARTGSGNTPLHWAVMDSPEMVTLMLARGADVNAKNSHGKTPLHIGAETGGCVPEIRMLLAHGAGVDSCAAGKTPLAFAIKRGHVDVARVLVEAGATVSPEMFARARRYKMDFVVAAAARWGCGSLRSAWVAACVCPK